MNYQDIKDLAFGYADRQDPETVDKYDFFLRVVESRINQVLKVQKMSCRTQLKTREAQEYYGLPTDFLGLRDIEIFDQATPNDKVTLEYLNPKQMNDLGSGPVEGVFYTIIADQLYIKPAQRDKILEIIYYRRVPPLKSAITDGDAAENWVSKDYPDLYVFGTLVEISSFVKDAAALDIWNKRFELALESVRIDDTDTRWSGTPLQMRTA